MFKEPRDLSALHVYQSRSVYCYSIEYRKGSARFRNVLLKDLIHPHSFDLIMRLALCSVGPIIVCDPTDISFIIFREIQSNALEVQTTHKHTHSARWSQKPKYVKKQKTYFTKPVFGCVQTKKRNIKMSWLRRGKCLRKIEYNCQNYVQFGKRQD